MPDELIIPRSSKKPIRGIYSPRVHAIAQGLGKVETRRASHVEPGSQMSPEALLWLHKHYDDHEHEIHEIKSKYTTYVKAWDKIVMQAGYENSWFADCLPVGGPVLGPFDDRDTALEKESEWLRANNIPTCRECADAEVQHSIQIEPPSEPVLTQADLDRMG